MENDEQRPGVFSDYFGFDSKTLFTFSCLVVGVIIVVTGIYVAIFGFDNWKSSMSQASTLMLSNFNNPNGVAGTEIGPVSPRAPGITSAQYTCPNCGAVGLPRWSQNGAPLCPNCGTVMRVTVQAGGANTPRGRTLNCTLIEGI